MCYGVACHGCCAHLQLLWHHEWRDSLLIVETAIVRFRLRGGRHITENVALDDHEPKGKGSTWLRRLENAEMWKRQLGLQIESKLLTPKKACSDFPTAQVQRDIKWFQKAQAAARTSSLRDAIACAVFQSGSFPLAIRSRALQ